MCFFQCLLSYRSREVREDLFHPFRYITEGIQCLKKKRYWNLGFLDCLPSQWESEKSRVLFLNIAMVHRHCEGLPPVRFLEPGLSVSHEELIFQFIIIIRSQIKGKKLDPLYQELSKKLFFRPIDLLKGHSQFQCHPLRKSYITGKVIF